MNPEELIGHEILDSNGEKIGKVARVYVTEDENRRPEWVTVKLGLLGGHETFVPLNGCSFDQHGLRVATEKQTVKDAPATPADGHLSQQESAELYRHYGMQAPTADGGTDRGGMMPPQPRTEARGELRNDPSAMSGRAGMSSAPEEMVRSEERLHVDKETVESGRAKLTKHVVTEEQQMTVPVKREELRIEREPIDDPSMVRDATIGESEQEIVLHEERPTVHKETVAVERVRLGTETVTDEQVVGGEVRKEQVEISDPSERSRKR